ncbi:MAG: L-rhamnose isomerase [Oscillospiraceae bacterium]|nr:L-rhamnose isomerase [Oscillospiraceae bacterium]
MNEAKILKGYEYAKEAYAAVGVDADAAMARADAVPVSMHCWQGDDVIGFDGVGELTGGIATTGNYPGRARTPEELRADIAQALKFIPGSVKLNMHACYAEKNGENVDRDGYTIKHFENWVAFAKEHGLGLDFNPTFFSHPKMDGDFSLASPKEATRRFWIEHGKRCREIGYEMGKATGQPCVVNYWMPDGFKDTCADTLAPRIRMAESLDEIFAPEVDESVVPCAIESKLFGVGVESYTVASHEFSYGYAVKNNKLYCLDAGHFHPTEVISAKLSACLMNLDKVLLHVSRGIRWDSDHVITLDDELRRIMDEVVFNGLEDRVYIGLDYFDASINRVACWAIGMRNARKALLDAYLCPVDAIRKAEADEDYTLRLALQEERRTLPMGAVWDYYCMTRGVGNGSEWIDGMKQYEKKILALR